MMYRAKAVTTIATAAGALVLASPAAHAQKAAKAAPDLSLVPHIAEYQIAIVRTVGGKKVQVANGHVTISLKATCKGWHYRTSGGLKGQPRKGDPGGVLEDIHESYDGRRLRLTREVRERGEKFKISLTGTFGDKGMGEGFAAGPQGRALYVLPKGMVFPIAYLRRAIRLAKAGKVRFRIPVFGAIGRTGAVIVRTDVSLPKPKKGEEGKAGAKQRKRSDPLMRHKYFILSQAFFDANAPDRQHLSRSVIWLTPAGLQTRIEVIDIDVLTIAKLVKAEPLPVPPCLKRKKADPEQAAAATVHQGPPAP